MAEHNSQPKATGPALHLLVLRCQAGDERAFARLVAVYGPRTLGYLRGLVGDAAEDVQQEVWLAVYRGIARLVNPSAFRTWLYRTTRHRALDYLRKERRERELIADVPMETAEVAAPEGEEPRVTEAMLEALSKLGTAHREMILLRYRDEMNYAEIGLVVGCSIGTVRSRLHYAKQRLQELAIQEGDRERIR